MSSENTAQALPLVSVICRSIGRHELQQALQSVSAQSYPNLEIVLIDASGKGVGDVTQACAKIPVRLVSDGKHYSRSQAANAGLDTATGEYLMFLDDDDWIAADHIENLVTRLQSQPEIKAAYSNTQKTDRLGAPLDYVFKDDFDPVLLMRDNFIPIHAMLFQRDLLQHNVRFEESFDIYEDWDFWLQLSQHTDFSRVDKTTAFYREGGESETAAIDTHSRYNNDSLLGKGRAAIFNKWLPRWSGAQINQLIGRLDQSQILQDLAVTLHNARVSLGKALHEQQKLKSDLDQAALQIADKETVIADNLMVIADKENVIKSKDSVIADRQRYIVNLEQDIANQSQHITELNMTLDSIFGSTTWKLMGPVRRIARFTKSLFRNTQGDKQ